MTYRDRLIPTYVDYCTRVSQRSMAIAIETAAFLWATCVTREARAVCDLGSGYTSYVLRRYATEAAWPVHVVSVDDDTYWLNRTFRFCADYLDNVTGLVDWSTWQQNPQGPFDVIVHDFASGTLREQSMWNAADNLAPGGALIFDDGQHDGHRAVMEQVAAAHHLTVHDIRALTEDDVHRYAVMAA